MSVAVISWLALAAAQAGPEPATPEVLTFERALQTFQRVCVDTLPDPHAFTDAMNTIGVRWRKIDKSPAEIFGTGNSWRSTLGEITYHNPPYRGITLGGPACHFEFHPDNRYVHAEASAALRAILNLPVGRDTGRPREPQMRWETELANGMSIRVFLTSNVEIIGGRGARLSISRRHPLPPELDRRIREIEN